MAILEQIGLIENYNTFDTEVAEFSRVEIDHTDSYTTQLDDHQTLDYVELLETFLLCFSLRSDFDSNRSLGNSLSPFFLLFIARLG